MGEALINNSVRGLLPGGMGHVMGCGERAFGACTRCMMGCLGRGTKGGEREGKRLFEEGQV